MRTPRRFTRPLASLGPVTGAQDSVEVDLSYRALQKPAYAAQFFIVQRAGDIWRFFSLAHINHLDIEKPRRSP